MIFPVPEDIPLNTYEVFYRNRRATVEARTPYDAQKKYAEANKVKKSWEVNVVLAAVGGTPVVHSTASL